MTEDDVAKQQVAEKLAAFEATTLFVLALVLGSIYTLRMGASFLILPLSEAITVSTSLSLSVLLSVAIVIAHLRKRLRPNHVRPLMALLGGFVTFNVFFILHSTGNLAQLYFSVLVLVAFGLGSLSFTMWIGFTVPFILVYLGSLAVLGITGPAPYIAMLIGGIALSCVAYFIRVPTIRRLTELEVVHAANAKKLAMSNKAKDRFLANMTHELRTPMTGVIGMVDLLADTKLDEEQRSFLGTARKSARYLLTVINDILDVSKLDAGKLTIKHEPLEAAQLTKDVVALFEMRVAKKGLGLALELPDEACFPVRGDGVRISQILLNLLENALKFTSEGTITVKLVARREGDICYLTWKVQDTGVGIPDDRLPTLFERFEQIDNSKTRTTPGTGLGLSIVRDLVDLMTGTLGVDSEEGKGSEFRFSLELPALEANAVTVEAASYMPSRLLRPTEAEYTTDANDGSHAGTPDAAEDGQLSILFAEDNPINRKLIGRLIEREGWFGTAVTNGQEAVEAIARDGTKYDIILMDIQMPVMDGVTALERIQADSKHAPPIIALTANTLPDDVAQYEKAGFAAIVGKPIDMTILRAEVTRLSGGSSRGGLVPGDNA